MTDIKTQRAMPYLLSLLIFGLFLVTLHPSITAGDSGEISAAAFSLGIPHPSGYPFYVIIAKLFTLALPFGSIAYRVNMASAIFGALSCGMVYLITKNIVGAGPVPAQDGQPQGLPLPLPALFASLSLAFSYQLWYRSTVAEVYTLNAFLLLLIIYVLLVWREQSLEGRGGLQTRPYTSRYLYLASFLFGLGVGNHHTIVLVIPGAIAFVLWTVVGAGLAPAQEGQPQSLPLRLSSLVSRLSFFFLLGLSIYLYLPVRSARNPFMDWGDPQNIQNFIDVFTRKFYLPEGVARSWEALVKQIKTYAPFREFSIIGFLFGLFGLLGLIRRDKAVGTLLLLTLVITSYGLIFLAGSSRGDEGLFSKFYIPSYSIFSIFMGVGIDTLQKSGQKSRLRAENMKLPIILIAAASLSIQLISHYPLTSNADNYLAYDYGVNELNSLKEGAVYVSKGEVKTFPIWYLQGAEGYREDVTVVTAYFLTQRWYLREVLRIAGVPREIPQDLTYKQMLINSIYGGNTDKGVYTGFLDEEYLSKNILTYTQGITFQLYKNPEDRYTGDIWSIYRLRGVERIKEGTDLGMVEILKDYSSSHYNTGLEYYDEGDIDRAMTEFEKALAINPDDPDSLNNLAVIFAEKGIRLKEAESMARKALELYTVETDRDTARETIEKIEKKMKDPI